MAANVRLILVLYGLAIAAGNIIGGHLANRNPALALIGTIWSARPDNRTPIPVAAE